MSTKWTKCPLNVQYLGSVADYPKMRKSPASVCIRSKGSCTLNKVDPSIFKKKDLKHATLLKI